ncbi:MAG: hypothetical protein AB7P03_27245 [Kofleriaceae bacterium]
MRTTLFATVLAGALNALGAPGARGVLGALGAMGALGALGALGSGCVLELEATTAPSNDNDNEPDADNTPPPPLLEAKRLFDEDVYPIVAAKCADAACHGEDSIGATTARFVAVDPANGWALATSYASIVGNFDPADAPILGKMDTAHNGISYTEAERALIVAWLVKELELRGAQLAARRLFDQNVYPILAGKCAGSACHAQSASGATLSRFVADDPTDGWYRAATSGALVGTFVASTAPILRRLETEHYTASYGDQERAMIIDWLASELSLRGGP